MRKPIPNYQGSLGDYKDSMKNSPPTTYPEGFTPGPYVGFTPGASVPKAGDSKKSKPKKEMNEDPNNVRKMQDRLKVVVAEFDKQSAWVNGQDQGSLMKLGSEIDKLQRGIMRTKKKK
jgi:hypothetical protein